MPAETKNIAVLGSTGSIGTSALEVIEASGGRLRAVALSAHQKLSRLLEQARRLRPRWIVATDADAAAEFDWSTLPVGTELVVGPDGLVQVAAANEVDVVLAGIVGSAGLRSTWAALEAKKTVALANKETLVMAGGLVTKLAADRGGRSCRSTASTAPFFRRCKPDGARRCGGLCSPRAAGRFARSRTSS